MDAEHAWAARKLPLAAAGILEDDEETRLRAHIDGCEDCQGRWHEFADDPDPAGEHIPPTLLASWPKARAELSELELKLVDRHLDRCTECREDLRLAGQGRRSGMRRRPRRAPLLLGGIVTGAVAATFALLLLSPGGEPQRPPNSTGSLPWAVPSELRGEDATVVAPDTRELALTFATPPEFDLSRPAQVIIHDPSGNQFDSVQVPPAQLRRSSLIVVVRSPRPLAEGEYQVELRQPDSGTLRLRFGVVYASP